MKKVIQSQIIEILHMLVKVPLDQFFFLICKVKLIFPVVFEPAGEGKYVFAKCFIKGHMKP